MSERRREQSLRRLLSGSRNIRFADAVASAEAFGFQLSRVSGSHHINVFYSEEDAGYIADIPDLPHCAAFGKSPEEALQEVLKAKKAWLEAAHAHAKPIPEPRYRPVISQAGQ